MGPRKEHILVGKEEQCHTYNQLVQSQEFWLRDEVTRLVPSASCKFLAHWQGPRCSPRPHGAAPSWWSPSSTAPYGFAMTSGNSTRSLSVTAYSVKCIGRAQFISTLYLNKGYWQFLLAPSSHQKIMFSTSTGHWQSPPRTWMMMSITRPPGRTTSVTCAESFRFDKEGRAKSSR